MKLTITSITAAILSLIFLVLSVRVSRARRASKTSLGYGQQVSEEPAKGREITPLFVAARTQANFAEYVPFCLLMMALIEAQGGTQFQLSSFGSVLIAARLLHPFGMGRSSPNVPRFLGAALTYLLLLVGAIWLALLVVR
jgi:uncharacterized membrane protein YecN with MAPEG domain